MSLEETLAALFDAKLAPLRAELQLVTAELAAVRRAPHEQLAEEVLTVPEGAREAKVSTKTIRAACAAGAIQAHKPAGCAEWRFTRAALLAWLNPSPSTARPKGPVVDSDAGPRQAVAKIVRGTR